MNFTLHLILFSIIFTAIKSAKILGVFPAPGYSQFILAEVLMVEMAKRGHEVTVISVHKPKNEPKNYKTIQVSDVVKCVEGFDLFALGASDLASNIAGTYIYADKMTNYTLSSKEVQDLLNSKEHFDLVVMEILLNDALKGFAAHFKVPLVLVSSLPLTEWSRENLGIPTLPSISPVSYTSFRNDMSFSQRIINLYGTIYDYLYRHYIHYPKQRKYLEELFPNYINFDEIVNNASLMLVNSHFTTAESTLLPYNAIEIGGCHVTPTILDKNTEEILNNATDGVIFFSLGSNLQSSELSKDTLKFLFKTFSELKETVLWKFEADLADKPKNVFISKWLNQKGVLAHPNVKLFITHGGMLSVTESIFHGVPMLGIPVFIDQRMNIARAHGNGIAEYIPYLELSEQQFSSKLNQMLTDPRYSLKAKLLSNVMKDRPIRPLDLAVYWMEYAIKHKGFRFDLPTHKLYWFQLYSLDILGCFLIIILLVYFGLKKLLCNSTGTKRKVKKQ